MSGIMNPTVSPAARFNATEDATALRKAMKGLGCDDKVLVEIIPYRSNEQRQEIAQAFKTLFGRDLTEDIKSETSGNFKKLLVALLTPTLDYYVSQLKGATKGAGTNEDVLIEVLCGMPPAGIEVVNAAYHKKYGKTLEQDIVGDTSGHFKRLLVSICTAGRDSNNVVDVNRAKEDAQALFKAGEDKMGTDESVFNMIMCRRSFEHIKLVDREYVNLTGHSLEKAIDGEFSGYIKKGLKAVLKCSISKPDYFADILHKSMAGMGTNDDQLIRTMVCRSEFDLNEIKIRYEMIFNKSLKSWIKGDTSGNYRDCLLAIIREL